MTTPHCRFCDKPLTHTFVDLGKTPLANSYLDAESLKKPEPSFPLHARVCSVCFLVQVESVVPAEFIFEHYAYFSSYSTSWVAHAKAFTEMAVQRFGLGIQSKVVEIASNDGYLLRHFVDKGVPCLGVEPAKNVAEVAVEAGVPTEVRFFGRETAKLLLDRDGPADLMVANNVLAHVPDLNDFVGGFKILLAPKGVICVEFPHLLKLIEQVQFDTIYHEHYCYYSLVALDRIFKAHGLCLFDVEELPTHGGSLRIFVSHADAAPAETECLKAVKAREKQAKLDSLEGYTGFSEQVNVVCKSLKAFLKDAKQQSKKVVAYGAAAKGNTLLNVCGIGPDLIDYVVDRNPHKQNTWLPGSHIPVKAPEQIAETRPDYLLILPWNLADEIRGQMQEITGWGGQFVAAIPTTRVLS